MVPRCVLVTPLAVTLLAASAAPAPKPKRGAAEADVAKLQGAWQCVKYEQDGSRLPEGLAKKLTYTFKGNQVSVNCRLFIDATTKEFHVVEEAGGGTFRVDPRRKPRAIDFTVDNPGGEAEELAGVYQLDGDRLTICVNGKPGARPKGFDAKPGSGLALVVLKREKP